MLQQHLSDFINECHNNLINDKNDEILEKNKQYFLKVAQINNKRDMVDFLNRRYKNE